MKWVSDHTTEIVVFILAIGIIASAVIGLVKS